MVLDSVLVWLRLEGLAGLAFWLFLYSRQGGPWWVFAACFLLPDITMLGYLAGPRLGASSYNAGHSYLGPAVVAILLGHTQAGLTAALIWAAHIAFDRMLGYGLKYPEAFGSTHLGELKR